MPRANRDELKKDWGKTATNVFKGKTVREVRWLTTAEQDELGWYASAPVIIFTDNSFVFASADDEGNGPGAFFTSENKSLPILPVI